MSIFKNFSALLPTRERPRSEIFVPENPVPMDNEIEVNDGYREALELLKNGTNFLFVSGKAGTGKSTFIRYLRNALTNNIAVVAPTGVAALNVQGQTIHSFFKLPPRPVSLDSIRPARSRTLFEKLEVLVIDEISMVRADLLDVVNRSLQVNRERQEPFGGVQIVAVGDLFQLPPVIVREEEAMLLSETYKSPYFFAAKCLDDCKADAVEFTKVYRQKDEAFIDLLNRVREGCGVLEVVEILNGSCLRNHAGSEEEITLTCTNAQAERMNEQRLSRLPGQLFTYEGILEGKFNVEKDKLPSPYYLRLRAGAQVMFTKNDSAKRWVNGTIGTVTRLDNSLIEVLIKSGGQSRICQVQRTDWESYSYSYDHMTRKITANVIGTYSQFPLMLAWAVTIHKSQGQTLERVVIDLGDGAFAQGQTYVALSRCRSLSGIRLKRPLREGDILCDEVVRRFYRYVSSKKGIGTEIAVSAEHDG